MTPAIIGTDPIAEAPAKKISEISTKDVNHEEHQYLNLIRDILENGEHRPDR